MPRLEPPAPLPADLVGSGSAAPGEASAGVVADETLNVVATRDVAITIGRGI